MLIFIGFSLFVIFLLLLILYLGFLQIALFLSYLLAVFLFFVLLAAVRECFRVFKGNAPYVPSAKKLINKIIAEIDFKPNAVVYDLGCGDAKFLRALVSRKKVQASGYEYFIVPYLAAKFYNLFFPAIKIYYQDFFKVNLSKADYIFCFLLSKEMEHLEGKLKQELKSGALVIANTFQFKNWQPEKIIIVEENKKSNLNNKIYIYRK